MSLINSDVPLEKNFKKSWVLRNAFILGALRNVFMESERHVVSRIMVNIMIFQKTIPNLLIFPTYFFCWNFEQMLKNFLKENLAV